MAKRKICVVTGSRAEYGLLYWLMKDIEADPEMTLQLVVTGTHLAPAFGETYKMIQADGFVIEESVDIEMGDDTPTGISRCLGLAVIGIAQAFERLNPDIVVLLGDRFELVGAACCQDNRGSSGSERASNHQPQAARTAGNDRDFFFPVGSHVSEFRFFQIELSKVA